MSSRIVKSELRSVPNLAPALRDEMWRLFDRYYDGVTKERFLADLSAKQHVVTLFDQAGELRGFSTIQEIRTDYQGEPILTIFSGDTVIHRENWGQKGLQRVFSRYLLRTKLAHPRRRVFWFLISKGYKTFLLMRNNLRSYPDPARATPPEVKQVIDHLAGLKYPHNYDAAAGVIRFPRCVGAVKTGVAPVTARELENAEIRHFVQLNPGYAQGDELCCLAELTLTGLAAVALKYALVRPLRRLAGAAAALLGQVFITPFRLSIAGKVRPGAATALRS